MQLNYEFDRQLELERADAREEGREEGRKEGREEGREMLVYELVRNQTITLQQGADALNISVEELEEKMKKAGYTCP